MTFQNLNSLDKKFDGRQAKILNPFNYDKRIRDIPILLFLFQELFWRVILVLKGICGYRFRTICGYRFRTPTKYTQEHPQIIIHQITSSSVLSGISRNIIVHLQESIILFRTNYIENYLRVVALTFSPRSSTSNKL